VITTGTLAGTVSRASNGSPLAGASLTVLQNGNTVASTTSLASGAYTFSNLTFGAYDLRVAATGFVTEYAIGVPIVAAQTTTRNVALFLPGTLTGKITQADGVTPLAGAMVTASRGGTELPAVGTNGAGDYTITTQQPGTYLVRASNVGYKTGEQSTTVPEGGSATVNVSLALMPTGSVRYVYDELDRLVSVTDASGASATYTYDAVGNILEIRRVGEAGVSISEFTPNAGSVGSAVTIYGTGFSATPGQNAVTINGTTASVLTATAHQLSVTVPVGASTGPLAVTTPLGSAVATGNFVVAAGASGSPVITSITPSIVVLGTVVTVAGANFPAQIANNVVRFNGAIQLPTTVASNALGVPVPLFATSGRVTVTTPNGMAISPNDFFIAPPGFLASHVGVTGRLTFGVSQTPTFSTANQIGLLLFDGTAGQLVSVLATDATFGGCAGWRVWVTAPDGGVVGFYESCLSASGMIDTFALPAAGTYTVIVQPLLGQTGNITVTAYAVNHVVGPISADGTPVNISLVTPGQNTNLTFSGASGQRVSVLATSVPYGGCSGWELAVMRPDGSTLANVFPCLQAEGLIDAVTLPVAGTYAVRLNPLYSQTGNATLALHTIVDVTGPIAPDGTPVQVSLSSPGQNANLTFSGSVGQRVSVLATNVPYWGCGDRAWELALVRPDGTTLTKVDTCLQTEALLDAVTLPVAGTYTVRLNPHYTQTGSATLAVHTVVDVTGPIATNGSPVNLSLPTPGQNAVLTFTGTVGQQAVASVTNATFVACPGWTLSILRPDGTTLTSTAPCLQAGGSTPAQTLDQSGTHTVVLNPAGALTGTATVSLVVTP
jgi:YD repeat-containing protein